MKQIYLFFALLFATTLFAQIPQGFSYQAVALNGSGNAVASAPVKVRLSILDNSATGSAVYTETHNPTTNNMGLFTLTIGQGTPVTGTFSGINWGQNSKFLKVEIDVTNGTNYVTIGSSQLLAVPYAMYAGAVAGMGGSSGTTFNQLYLYGSFNNFDASTALPMNSDGQNFRGFKYLAAGAQLKFLPALNSTTPYGNSGINNTLSASGSNFVVNSPGFYSVYVAPNGPGTYSADFNSIAVKIVTDYNQEFNMSYDTASGLLYAYVTVPTNVWDPNDVHFNFIVGGTYYGDNLFNGYIEAGGSEIPLPGIGTYLIMLDLNFTGEGSIYEIQQN